MVLIAKGERAYTLSVMLCALRRRSYFGQVAPTCNFTNRLILIRSDSELQIYIFPSAKIIGLPMQSDVAKSDGIVSDLRIHWPKSSDSPHRIIKSKNGIGL